MTRSARAAALALLFLPGLLPMSAFPRQKDETFYESVDIRVVLGIRDEIGKTVSTVTAPYVPEAPAAARGRR